MPTSPGPSLSKWAILLLAGDILAFSLSVLLGYVLGSPTAWEDVVLQDRAFSLVALGLVYVLILYIGELYNYYLDFRQRENIGQVIL